MAIKINGQIEINTHIDGLIYIYIYKHANIYT